MARPPIEVGIASETKAFRQGVQSGIVEPLEDAAAALDDLGKNKGPEKLEREIEQAQKATKDLGREVDRTADAIEKDFRDTYSKVEKAADDGMDGAQEATKEFKQEALQNFSEVTSSFDGSMSSIQDLAQGTLGGLASSGLPGIGIAAGVAAAGVGLIGGAIEGVGDMAEAQKERVSESFRAMAQEGLEAWESVTAQNERLADAYDQHEDDIKKIADLTGLSFETVASAWAGNADNIAIVNAAYAEMKSELREIPGSTNEAVDATIRAWDSIIGPLNDTIRANEDALTKYERLAKQQSDNLIQTAKSAGTAIEEVDELGNRLLTLPDGEQILIDADTGLATTRLEKFKGDLDGVPAEINTKLTLTHNAESAVASMHRELAKANLSMRVKLKDQYGRDL